MAVGRAKRLRQHLGTPELRAVYLRQFYFSGVEGAALCLLAGASAAWVSYNLLHGRYHLGAETAFGTLASVGVRDLAPVFVPVLLVARSVLAIVTELATMKLNGEISMLRRHHIAPLEYLVAPRMAGFIAGAALLFVYFCAGLLLAGSLLSSPHHPLYALRWLAGEMPSEALQRGFLRCMAASSAAAMASCAIGLYAPERSTAVPKSAARAVIVSLLLIFASHSLFILVQHG